MFRTVYNTKSTFLKRLELRQLNERYLLQRHMQFNNRLISFYMKSSKF